MPKKTLKLRDTGCPIAFTLDLVGDRWTLLIIRDMIFLKKRHFREFLKSDEKIASNILADRLKMLTEIGIVEQSDDASSERKIIYSLTKKGKTLVPIVLEMVLWGSRFDSNTTAPKQLVDAIGKDRAAVIKMLTA